MKKIEEKSFNINKPIETVMTSLKENTVEPNLSDFPDLDEIRFEAIIKENKAILRFRKLKGMNVLTAYSTYHFSATQNSSNTTITISQEKSAFSTLYSLFVMIILIGIIGILYQTTPVNRPVASLVLFPVGAIIVTIVLIMNKNFQKEEQQKINELIQKLNQ